MTDDKIEFQVNPVKLTEALLTKWYSGEHGSGDADDAIDLLAEMAGYDIVYEEVTEGKLDHEFKPYADMPEYCVEELPGSGNTCNRPEEDHRTTRMVAKLVKRAPAQPPVLEIIHYRDSDEGCEHSYYLDGQPLKHGDPRLTIDATSLDPGRGWEFEEWAGNAIGAINSASEAARGELYDYFSYGSTYIDGWPKGGTEAENWLDHVEDTPENRQWWTTNFPDIRLDYLF